MPGSTCDYSFVRDRIVELHAKFQFQYAFDPAFARDTEQTLKRDYDITGVEFRQTMMNFTGPTTEFERLVIAGKLEHNGHPILTWQAGNTAVTTDNNNNKRPVKPPHGDHRKIDGVVGGIMALGLLTQNSDGGVSVYERRGFTTLA
jgi:phage terminase large subunit-like protein